MKIVSAEIPHKTEIGGVALDLATPEAVAAAVQRMATEIPSRAADARIEGYLVSEMVAGGVEMIVGARRDAKAWCAVPRASRRWWTRARESTR